MATVNVASQVVLPPILNRVSKLVEERPETLLIGGEETRAATLEAAKYIFDLSLQQEQYARAPVAQLLRSVEPSTGPQTRSSTKRKRPPTPPPRTDDEIWRPTPLELLHLEGMDDDQVWAQLELRTSSLCDVLKIVLEEDTPAGLDDEDGMAEASSSDELNDIEGFEGFEGLEDMDEDEDEDEGDDENDDDDDDDEENGGDSEEDALGEGVTGLRDPEGEGEGEDEDEMDLDRPIRPSARKRKGDNGLPAKKRGGHPVLDDGFFSLAEFNAETEEAEAKDVSQGRLDQDEDDEEIDLAEDEVDLFTPVDDVQETFEENDLEEGGEPYYKDFFAAPARGPLTVAQPVEDPVVLSTSKKSKVRFHDEVRVKNIKSRGRCNPVALMRGSAMWDDEEVLKKIKIPGKGISLTSTKRGLGREQIDEDFGEEQVEQEPDDSDMEADSFEDSEGGSSEQSNEGENERETIERLKNDLFAEDEDTPSKDLSSHEASQAEIAAQIAELETQNVAPKEWTLMGEATSRSRPVNSLLEEDLEFERVMKAVPVVTEETVHSLETVIKKRILDNRFDDVVRKRAVDDKPFLPSRFFELNDKKSAQSLAQIYEDEYSAKASGAEVDDRDGKLKKEHEEIEKTWDNICHKLDALSNAHFTPKQPKATISTVSNLSATTLESAIPTTKSTTTMLAPEEIFAAPSETRSREELTPIEKRAQRNKHRKARRKVKDQLASSVDKFARTQKSKSSAASIKREKDKALKSVVKAGKGVTVVGKQSADLKRHKTKQAVAAVLVDSKKLKL